MHPLQAVKLSGYPWETIRALELPADDYAVFGSAPLLAWGLITQIGDIDIITTRSAWRLACGLGTPVLAPGGDSVVHLAPGTNLYNGWLGLDVDAIVRRAETVDGLPIAGLDDVAAYKRLLDRPKDKVHLGLLEANRPQRRPMTPTLVFVYNADSGPLSALLDFGHKLVSPSTYPCSLCALTYGPLGMRREWRDFTQSLGLPLEFLHADELRGRYGPQEVALPAVFLKRDGLKPLLTRPDLDRLGSLGELKTAVTRALASAWPNRVPEVGRSFA